MKGDVKIVLVKLVLIIAILIAVDFTVGSCLKSFFYKQKSGKYYKITHAIKDSKEDIVIFGNSHAAEHFDAPLMQQLTSESVFNFGNGGQSFFYTYPVVKSILNRYSPKLIIVNMDYDDLAFYPKAYELLSIFLPYYNTNTVIDSAISLMPFNETLKCYSNLYRFNSTLGNTVLNTYVKKYTRSSEYLGYEPKIGNFCKNAGGQKKAESPGTKFDQNKINYLLRLIDAAKNRNIKLLITTTPLYRYNKTRNGVFKQKLQQILAKYNVPYLDYGTNPEFYGKCEYFNDNSHLNPAGASKWTKLCSQYIQRNGL